MTALYLTVRPVIDPPPSGTLTVATSAVTAMSRSKTTSVKPMVPGCKKPRSTRRWYALAQVGNDELAPPVDRSRIGSNRRERLARTGDQFDSELALDVSIGPLDRQYAIQLARRFEIQRQGFWRWRFGVAVLVLSFVGKPFSGPGLSNGRVSDDDLDGKGPSTLQARKSHFGCLVFAYTDPRPVDSDDLDHSVREGDEDESDGHVCDGELALEVGHELDLFFILHHG